MDRVYVANLPPDIRIKDIDDFFRPFGKLVYIDVNSRSNPVYAYVQFDSARNAFNAVKSRHGYDYEGYTLQLRLVENEVRKRRDATPPPPPPAMFNSYERQNSGGFSNNNGNSNRIGANLSHSSFQSNADSQWSNNNRSGMTQQQQNMIQYPTNDLNMSQQNMDYFINNRQQNIMESSSSRSNMPQQYSKSNRSDIQQQYSNSNRSNMQSDIQQQYFNSNRSNVQQQFSNSSRSNMHQQYSNSSRSNMPQQNTNYPNRSDMSQQNMMMPYSSNDRSNMQQQYFNTNRSNIQQQQQQMNMMDNSNNSSWNIDNSNMNWRPGNYGNDGNNYNNVEPNGVYNANNDPYAKPGFEDNYTSGLSGSGRKWFNRYIRQGLSPEVARNKALEHRTVPYLRDEPKNRNVSSNPTNMALETIGNTIMSLLSTNPVDNLQPGFVNNMRGSNMEMPGPSSSMPSQPPRNAVSKRQYLRSKDILRTLRTKRDYNAKDRISKKYHTQIVKDYEQFQRNSDKSGGASNSRDKRSSRVNISAASQEKLAEKLRRKKGELLKSAKSLKIDQEGRKRFGGAYKKRVKVLMHDAAFSEVEAKTLALHPLEKLATLMAIKKEYDILSKKSDFIPAKRGSLKETPKLVVYRSDIKYLNTYQKHRISNLSRRIIIALNECITRIHKYEKEQNLPLTRGKFISLLQKIYLSQKKELEGGKKAPNATKNIVVEKKITAAATTSNKKKVEKKGIENVKVVDEKLQPKEEKDVKDDGDNRDNETITEVDQHNENIVEDDQDNENIAEDDQDNENIAENDQDSENIAEDDQDNENIAEDDQDNENIAEDDQEVVDITEEQDEEELEDIENVENDSYQNEDVEDNNDEE